MKVFEGIGILLIGSLVFAVACTGDDPDGGPGLASADPARDGSRLKARYLVAGDGAKQFQTWFDGERQESCRFVQSAGRWTCLPMADSLLDGNTTTELYSDRLCRQRVAGDNFVSARYGCQQDFRYYVDSSNVSCGEASATYTIYALQPKIDFDVYSNLGGTCEQSFETWYPIIERLPMTDFVSADLGAP